jgi:hypothetical protein
LAPFYPSLSSAEQALIQRYQATGGKVYVVTNKEDLGTLKAERSAMATLDSVMSDVDAAKEVLRKIATITSGETSVALEGSPHVLANVTATQGRNQLVLHLLNYDSRPATNLHVKLVLGSEFVRLQNHQPNVASPNLATPAVVGVRWKGSDLEFTLPHLSTYTVVCLRKATVRLSLVSSALYTTPMPPPPNFSKMR